MISASFLLRLFKPRSMGSFTSTRAVWKNTVLAAALFGPDGADLNMVVGMCSRIPPPPPPTHTPCSAAGRTQVHSVLPWAKRAGVRNTACITCIHAHLVVRALHWKWAFCTPCAVHTTCTLPLDVRGFYFGIRCTLSVCGRKS